VLQLAQLVLQRVQQVEQPRQPPAEQMVAELCKQQVLVHPIPYNDQQHGSAPGRVDMHPFCRHRQPLLSLKLRLQPAQESAVAMLQIPQIQQMHRM
jgi:hypothetical protein